MTNPTESLLNTGKDMAKALEVSKGYESCSFQRFELTSYRIEFVFLADDEYLYLTGDDILGVWQNLANRPDKETRELNQICEALAKIEGMADKIESLAIRKIIDDIVKPLAEARKMIADQTGGN